MKKALFLIIVIVLVLQARLFSQTCQSACSANYQMTMADYDQSYTAGRAACDDIPLPPDIAAEAANEILENLDRSPEVAAAETVQAGQIVLCGAEEDTAFVTRADAAETAEHECVAGCPN